MSAETDYFHQAVKRGTVVLTCRTASDAKRERLRLYHFRRIAALEDPRVLSVKMSLTGAVVLLTFTPSTVESVE